MEEVSKKDILYYMDHPVSSNRQNIMGCFEDWYNPLYAICKVFTREEIESFSEEECRHLHFLAMAMSEALY